jgi:hypothetical protein
MNRAPVHGFNARIFGGNHILILILILILATLTLGLVTPHLFERFDLP